MHLADVIRINDKALPTPDGVSISKNKIWSKNAGRTAAGYMVGDIVARKYKIEISYTTLTAAQVQEITAACDTDAFVRCIFKDPYTNALKEIEVYGGDISLAVKQYYVDNTLYNGLKISMIER